MATRCQFENSNDIGVFAKLTSAYSLVAQGGSENFYRCVMLPAFRRILLGYCRVAFFAVYDTSPGSIVNIKRCQRNCFLPMKWFLFLGRAFPTMHV